MLTFLKTGPDIEVGSKRQSILKYLNDWKIAGLRPAIFSGTPRNFETNI